MTKPKLKKPSILKVGDGRGFVIPDLRHKDLPPLVITAAHCIPEAPPPHLWRYPEEETFRLLGPIGGEPGVFATVLFYEPIGDVAVLGPPDDQEMSEEAEAYEELLARYAPLAIAAPCEQGTGFVYDLAGELQSITYRSSLGPFKEPWVHVEGYGFKPGMSGSPIVDEAGRALALVSTSVVSTSGTSGTSGNMASPSLCSAIPSRIRIARARRSRSQ